MRLAPLLVLPAVRAYVAAVKQEVVAEKARGEALGLGVHFTTSYAAAAVMYEDGSVEDLVRVPADAEWIAAMGRWADGKNARCVTPREQLECGIEEARDYGRQSAQNVAILSVFMRRVLEEADRSIEFQQHTTTALATFPILPALDDRDIRAALERNQLSTPGSLVFAETNAAFAGLRNGLCVNWRDRRSCAEELADMEPEATLFLSFDNSSFSATFQTLSTPYTPFDPSLAFSIIDVELGWDSLPVYEVARAKFWARIQEIIMDVASKGETIDRVVIVGDFGRDEEFWEVAKGALEGKCREGETVVQVDLREVSGTTAARGAAEIAGRAEYSRRETERITRKYLGRIREDMEEEDEELLEL